MHLRLPASSRGVVAHAVVAAFLAVARAERRRRPVTANHSLFEESEATVSNNSSQRIWMTTNAVASFAGK